MALHLGALEISSFIRAHQWSIPITALRVWAKAFYPEGVYVCVCFHSATSYWSDYSELPSQVCSDVGTWLRAQ